MSFANTIIYLIVVSYMVVAAITYGFNKTAFNITNRDDSALQIIISLLWPLELLLFICYWGCICLKHALRPINKIGHRFALIVEKYEKSTAKNSPQISANGDWLKPRVVPGSDHVDQIDR